MTQYALFDTAIGFAGIAWNEAGLVGCHLPEHDPEASRRSFLRKFPEATEGPVPARLAGTVDGIRALMRGEIAVKLGDRLLARDVGAALGANPWPIVVPCHRVTAAGGKLGGFSARGGVNTKVKLLAIEGAKVLEPAPPKAAKPAPAPQPSLFD